VAAVQDGNRAALDTLLRRHYDRLYALCRRMTGDDADAADACQEALMAIVRGLPGFDGRSAFGTWAYRVATNACLDELRRRSRRPLAGLDDRVAEGSRGLDGTSRVGDDPGEGVAGRLDLDAALATLSHDHRAAVVLRDLCQLDYAEIGEVLGIPSGTVRSRIARGRSALAEAMGASSGPDRGNPADLGGRPTTRP
jgi:RNA polymerase sigma-70 factor (ECF subfamily)